MVPLVLVFHVGTSSTGPGKIQTADSALESSIRARNRSLRLTKVEIAFAIGALRLRALERNGGEESAVGRQRRRSAWHLGGAQEVREELDGFCLCDCLVAERHRENAIEQSAKIPAAPRIEELRTSERGRLFTALELVAVTRRASREVDLLAGVGLLRGVDAGPDGL